MQLLPNNKRSKCNVLIKNFEREIMEMNKLLVFYQHRGLKHKCPMRKASTRRKSAPFIKTLKLGQNKQCFLVIHTENNNIKKGRE